MSTEVICQYLPGVCDLATGMDAQLNALRSLLLFQDLSVMNLVIATLIVSIEMGIISRISSLMPLTYILIPGICIVFLNPGGVSTVLIMKFITNGFMILFEDRDRENRLPKLIIVSMLVFFVLVVQSTNTGYVIPGIVLNLGIGMFVLVLVKAMPMLPPLLPIFAIVMVVLFVFAPNLASDLLGEIFEKLAGR
jgi:hypothetical protein